MDNSTFKICPACNNVISEGEAVAVCEKCGKTYHASCYANGGCTDEACKVVEAPAINPVVVTNTCKKCGGVLAEGQRFCPACGSDSLAVAPVAPAAPTQSPKKKSAVGLVVGLIVAFLAVIGIIGAVVLFILFRPVAVDDIVMEEKEIEIVEGENFQIEYTVYPAKATIKNSEWSSSDEDVAEVSDVGRVEAVSAGECTITLEIDGVEAEVKVVVKKDLPDFNEIYDEYCSSDWAEVGSDGTYLEIDSNPNDYDSDYYYLFSSDSKAANAAIEKIHAALGIPDSVYRDMNNTTWSMGKQSETFDDIGIKIEWTYHPDKGLEVTYKYIHS